MWRRPRHHGKKSTLHAPPLSPPTELPLTPATATASLPPTSPSHHHTAARTNRVNHTPIHSSYPPSSAYGTAGCPAQTTRSSTLPLDSHFQSSGRSCHRECHSLASTASRHHNPALHGSTKCARAPQCRYSAPSLHPDSSSREQLVSHVRLFFLHDRGPK